MGMKSTGFLIHFNFNFPPQAVYWYAIVMLVGLFFFSVGAIIVVLLFVLSWVF